MSKHRWFYVERSEDSGIGFGFDVPFLVGVLILVLLAVGSCYFLRFGL